MNRYIVFIIVLLYSFNTVAQVNATDTIGKDISLDEVVISASNITRVDDHLLIFPDERQRKHANNAYGVLKNLMIPGLIVDSQSNHVEAMGMRVSLYINGQECDSKEVQMIRPRDIEKIEYHDAPTGKYAKDHVAINFVLKQYKSGGYFQIEGLQTVGYAHGDYNGAGSISKGKTTFSLFAGSNFYNVSGNDILGLENYIFPEEPVTRETDANTKYKKHNEYVQLRIQNQNGKRYFVGKFSFVNNHTPYFQNVGELNENKVSSQFKSETELRNLAPKLDFNGNIPLSETGSLAFGLHGKYSRNTYSRYYEELPFCSDVSESENVGEFQISAIYNRYAEKSSFSTELYHYYDVWDAEYISGGTSLWQHLWKSESLAFMAYNYRFTKKLSLRSRVGFDWYQYRLHACDKFSQLSPRFNLNIQYQFGESMILWSYNYANYNYGMDVINKATVEVNPYMIETGNPDLEKSHEVNTYIYYTTKIRKIGITAMCQYKSEHNPVMYNYDIDDDRIIRSYINEGDIRYFSLIAAVTCPLCENLMFSGDVRYNYTQVDAMQNLHNNDFTGNIRMNMYAGKFSLSPYVNFNKKNMDHKTLAVQKKPFNYGIACTYSDRNMFVEIQCVSPFVNREERSLLHTPYYTYNRLRRNRIESNYCNIKFSYSLDFGRKTNRIKREIDHSVNSALLRVTP